MGALVHAGVLALALWVVPAGAAPFAYITNSGSNTVSVIDLATNAVDGPAIPVGTQPYGVAANTQGTRVYVTNVASNTVSVIDTATRAVAATIPVGAAPHGIAVNATGTRVYVASQNSGTVSVIDAAHDVVTATIPMPSAYAVAVNPAGTRVYVTHVNGTSVIDAATNLVIADYPESYVEDEGQTLAGAVAVDPAGTCAYITLRYPPLFGSVRGIPAATSACPASGDLHGGLPAGIAVDPSGGSVYATNDGLFRFDTSSGVAIQVNNELLADGPQGVAVHPSGGYVYTANSLTNTVAVISTSTDAVIARIPVGNAPVALGQFIGPAPPSASPTIQWYYNGANVPNPSLAIGTTAVWHLTPGAGIAGVTYPATLQPDAWHGEGAVADTSADGIPDVIWVGAADAPTRPVARWVMDALGNIAASQPMCDCSPAMTEWAVGDLDGDRRADLIARSASGQLRVGYAPASGPIVSWRDLGAVPLEWSLRGVGDVNGDGVADLVWYRPVDGVVAIWLMHADGTYVPAFPGGGGAGWQPYKVADFDGDGKADIWWRNIDGTNAVWYMNGGAIDDTDFFIGTPLDQWRLGAATDLNADGRADVLWYGPNSGAVVRWTMTGRHASPIVDPLANVGPGWQIVQ